MTLMWETVSVKYFKKKNPNIIAVSIIQDRASSKRPVNTTGSSEHHCEKVLCVLLNPLKTHTGVPSCAMNPLLQYYRSNRFLLWEFRT